MSLLGTVLNHSSPHPIPYVPAHFYFEGTLQLLITHIWGTLPQEINLQKGFLLLLITENEVSKQQT